MTNMIETGTMLISIEGPFALERVYSFLGVADSFQLFVVQVFASFRAISYVETSVHGQPPAVRQR
jgi:hypothetical protein